MRDVIIIGGGPAGVTASLYTARAGFKTVIICNGLGALQKAETVANFYGHMEISGTLLAETGLNQAEAVGVEIIPGEVVNIAAKDFIEVETTENSYQSRTALLATGATRATPKINGLPQLIGKGVSYCAVCDGFFFKGKDVAVLGSKAYALHEAEELLPLANSVTILTNGEEASFPANFKVNTKKIKEFTAKEGLMGLSLKGVIFEDGGELELAGLFIAVGVAGGTELAKKIGADIEGNIKTNIPNFWAAGDCTGGLKQIAKAVYEGAEAGTDIVKYLRGLNHV